MKITLSELDNLISKSMGNMDLKSTIEPQDKEIDSLAEPIVSFLDNEESQEKSKIQDFTRTKSVISDPDEKKIKDRHIRNSQEKVKQINQTRTDLLNNKENLKKAALAKQQDLQFQLQQMQKNAAMLDSLKNQTQELYEKYYSMPIMKRVFPNQEEIKMQEQNINPVQPTNQVPNQAPKPEPKTFRVKFEGSTPNPFEVYFSERGFKIGNTRLSFEAIEEALSKNFTITLDNGAGLVLDAVRMQKILKYKNRA